MRCQFLIRRKVAESDPAKKVFHTKPVLIRVARWHIFEPKIPIWVKFGGYWMECNLWQFGLFTTIWYILWPFGTFYGFKVYFSPFWYVVPIKIWQPWFWSGAKLPKVIPPKKVFHAKKLWCASLTHFQVKPKFICRIISSVVRTRCGAVFAALWRGKRLPKWEMSKPLFLFSRIELVLAHSNLWHDMHALVNT
jgi:hypothetical protein